MKHPSTLLAAAALASACAFAQNPATEKTAMPEPQTPAVVYFTHDISPEGLAKAYKALGRPLEGRKVAVKISTGEAGNDHYLKPALIGPLVQSLKGDIVECNTAYAGKRMKTSDHRKVIADHGFNDIAKVVILDEFADAELPTPAGSVHLKSDRVGAALTNYTGFVILNHFKGHQMGGFGGALSTSPSASAPLSAKRASTPPAAQTTTRRCGRKSTRRRRLSSSNRWPRPPGLS